MFKEYNSSYKVGIKELEKIKDWRKVLSNFYTKPKEDEKVVADEKVIETADDE